jgi:hypothetical protein
MDELLTRKVHSFSDRILTRHEISRCLSTTIVVQYADDPSFGCSIRSHTRKSFSDSTRYALAPTLSLSFQTEPRSAFIIVLDIDTGILYNLLPQSTILYIYIYIYKRVTNTTLPSSRAHKTPIIVRLYFPCSSFPSHRSSPLCQFE